MTTARFIAGLVKRNSATASGRTTSAFLGSTPSSSDDLSIAGRLASELCVLIATAIGLTPIGMLLIGGLSSAAGAQVTMASMASLGFIGLLLVLIRNPQLRAAKIG